MKTALDLFNKNVFLSAIVGKMVDPTPVDCSSEDIGETLLEIYINIEQKPKIYRTFRQCL